MDDRAAVIGHGRTFVPNLFTIELAPTDFDRLTGFADLLTDELVASAQEHAESQRYQPGGPIQVSFLSKEDLETGVFRVRPATAKGAAPAAPTSSPAGPAVPAAAGPPHSGPSGSASEGQPGPDPLPGDGWAQVPAANVPPGQTARHEPVPPSRQRTHPAQRPWLEVDGDLRGDHRALDCSAGHLAVTLARVAVAEREQRLEIGVPLRLDVEVDVVEVGHERAQPLPLAIRKRWQDRIAGPAERRFPRLGRCRGAGRGQAYIGKA